MEKQVYSSNSFWRVDETEPQHKSQKSTKDLWYYHDKLRYYLLAVGKDLNATESIDKFPVRLNLSTNFDEMSFDMLNLTRKDGIERFSVIAVGNDYSNILLPIESAKGESNSVSLHVAAKHERDAEEAGAENVIGSFHTHPATHGYKSILRRISSIYSSAFSVGDLFMPVFFKRELISGVLQTNNEAVVVFRTKETDNNNSLEYLPSGLSYYKRFSDYWLKTKNLMMDHKTGAIITTDNRKLTHDSFHDLMWEINLSIAEKHKLAIYRGRVGWGFGRFYPYSVEAQLDDYFKGKTNICPDFSTKK